MKHFDFHQLVSKLENAYGPPPEYDEDPTDLLVLTILSQNTNDRNRDRAYESLRKVYSSNESLLHAHESELAETIRSCGLNVIKSKRIIDTLKTIKQRMGSLDLRFLGNLTYPDAKKFLRSIKGIGPKTTAIVLSFCFRHPSFPVDTHIYRILKRLPLIEEKDTRESAHEKMDAIVPENLIYPLHL